jgi:hypothetical protein
MRALHPYNGFDHAARKATVPIQNQAIRKGLLRRPDTCSICKFSVPEDLMGRGYIFLHLEDYRRPLDILPCCKSCHAALHARFENPERWFRRRASFERVDAWFMALTMDPASQAKPFDEIYPKGLPPLLSAESARSSVAA